MDNNTELQKIEENKEDIVYTENEVEINDTNENEEDNYQLTQEEDVKMDIDRLIYSIQTSKFNISQFILEFLLRKENEEAEESLIKSIITFLQSIINEEKLNLLDIEEEVLKNTLSILSKIDESIEPLINVANKLYNEKEDLKFIEIIELYFNDNNYIRDFYQYIYFDKRDITINHLKHYTVPSIIIHFMNSIISIFGSQLDNIVNILKDNTFIKNNSEHINFINSLIDVSNYLNSVSKDVENEINQTIKKYTNLLSVDYLIYHSTYQINGGIFRFEKVQKSISNAPFNVLSENDIIIFKSIELPYIEHIITVKDYLLGQGLIEI